MPTAEPAAGAGRDAAARQSGLLLGLGALAACQQPAADQTTAVLPKVPCALAGAAAFEARCTTERVTTAEGVMLTIRHPDGGFRRFAILADGRGLVAADGFDDSKVRVIDSGRIELSAGRDRYRLPATVRDSAAR